MKGEPMGDCMNFPDTVDEYMEQYKMTDVRQVYSNGIEYVPIFRMKQWFEHEKDQPPVQPEPKEGHWIRRDSGFDAECKCSVCGYKDFVPQNDTYWFNRNYCPNCGAKMTISTK